MVQARKSAGTLSGEVAVLAPWGEIEVEVMVVVEAGAPEETIKAKAERVI